VADIKQICISGTVPIKIVEFNALFRQK